MCRDYKKRKKEGKKKKKRGKKAERCNSLVKERSVLYRAMEKKSVPFGEGKEWKLIYALIWA